MKRILFATSEAVPFIKTGGLADVAGSLPKCFDKRYFDIRVILPKYACMKQEWKDKMEYVTHFYMDLGYKNCYVGILQMEYDGIKFYFIDNEYYFSGPKPYDSAPWDLEKKRVRVRPASRMTRPDSGVTAGLKPSQSTKALIR